MLYGLAIRSASCEMAFCGSLQASTTDGDDSGGVGRVLASPVLQPTNMNRERGRALRKIVGMSTSGVAAKMAKCAPAEYIEYSVVEALRCTGLPDGRGAGDTG